MVSEVDLKRINEILKSNSKREQLRAYSSYNWGVCVLSHFSRAWLWDTMDCSPPGSSVHGDCPGKNTGVDRQALLQGICPIQGSNLRLLSLLHWQAGSLPLGPPEKPTTGVEVVNGGDWRYTQKRLKPIVGGFGCEESVFNSLKETSLKVIK